jgi:hypothetical protein
MLLDHHVEFRLGRTASAMVPSTGDEADEVTGVSGVNVSPDDPYRRGGEVFDWPGNWFGLAMPRIWGRPRRAVWLTAGRPCGAIR